MSLTIDNTDGVLPIEYAEVTITRIMFRNGGSEYQLNGDTCRLLDIQELLSDSGIGREMHVIVGQGQLDSVLHADPMGRRAFIEEAAGVLKHRKRKEKALRKLDAMQANLARVTDLTGELRRQLKPLGRQAQVARRAAVIQADLRDARLRLLADDLVTLREALRAEVADEAALKERRDAVESELAAAVQREARLEEQVRALTPRVNDAQATWYALSQLTERVRGTIGLAEQRHRHAVGQPAEERRGRDPEDMEREAARIREQEAELTEALDAAERALEDTVGHRAELERRLAEEETRLRVAARAIADRREGLARLNAQVNAARSKAGSAEAEIGRLAAARDEARDRAESAQAEYEELRAQVESLDADDTELEARFEAARAAQAAAEEEFSAAREAATTAERRRAAVAARRDALAPSLRRKDGTGALLARAGAPDGLAGVLGSAATLLRVTPGYEVPVAAALGVAADAVAVTGPAAAAEALRLLRKEDGGRAALLLAAPPATTEAVLPGQTAGDRTDPGRDTGRDAARASGGGVAAPDGGDADRRVQESGAPAHAAGDRTAADRAAADRTASAVAAPGLPAPRPEGAGLPAQARDAVDLVAADAGLLPAVRRLLHGFVVVPTLDDAEALVARHPELTAVTAEGDVLAAHLAQGGSAKAPSVLEVQAQVDEASAELERLAEECAELAERQQAAKERRPRRRGRSTSRGSGAGPRRRRSRRWRSNSAGTAARRGRRRGRRTARRRPSSVPRSRWPPRVRSSRNCRTG